jgi:hypothetical protein
MMTYGAEALYLAGTKTDPATYTDMIAKGVSWSIGYDILTRPGIDLVALKKAEEPTGQYFFNCLRDMLAFGYTRITTGDDSPLYYPTAKLRAQYPSLKNCQVVEDDGEWIEYDGVF